MVRINFVMLNADKRFYLFFFELFQYQAKISPYTLVNSFNAFVCDITMRARVFQPISTFRVSLSFLRLFLLLFRLYRLLDI